jgi:hypothetical protein
MDRSPVEDSATNHVTEGASQSAAEAVVVGKEPAVLSDAAIVAVPETTSVAVLEATALDSISWKKADTGHTWTQVNTAYSKIVDAARKNRWLATSGKDSVLELAPLVVFLEARSMLGFEKYILGITLPPCSPLPLLLLLLLLLHTISLPLVFPVAPAPTLGDSLSFMVVGSSFNRVNRLAAYQTSF